MSGAAGESPLVTTEDEFGYAYFDDPTGDGYRGYSRAGNGDGYLPWEAARRFCATHGVHTAIDLGCAKGFVVEALRRDDVDAAGYDISRYALSAATTLATLDRTPVDVDWHLVATGSAGRFARQELPHLAYYDLDTLDPAEWHQFLDVAPSGGLVISNTNPDFAAWAVGCGYEVGIVDTLDWMWPSLPAGIEEARFHLVQAFFGGSPAARNPAPRAEVVAPIVDSALWRPGRELQQHGSAVIGFGGMHLPGYEHLTADYVRWFLDAALDVLLEEVAVTDVAIVGGRADLTDLVPQQWARHTGVRVLSAVPRRQYARLCRRAEHLLIAPGLTSIYECAASGLAPFLQPGFSMSMAFQSLRIRETGYPYACTWPWLDEVTRAIAGLSEEDGVAHVAGRIRDTVDDPGSAGFLTEAVRRYATHDKALPELRVTMPRQHPRAPDRLAYHVHAWHEAMP